MEPQQNSKKGIWLVIVLVLLLIIAGAYYWAMMSQTPDAISGQVQSGLEAVSFDDLDTEIQLLDTDLNQL